MKNIKHITAFYSLSSAVRITTQCALLSLSGLKLTKRGESLFTNHTWLRGLMPSFKEERCTKIYPASGMNIHVETSAEGRVVPLTNEAE